MKKCTNCNSRVPNKSDRCLNCGSRLLVNKDRNSDYQEGFETGQKLVLKYTKWVRDKNNREQLFYLILAVLIFIISAMMSYYLVTSI